MTKSLDFIYIGTALFLLQIQFTTTVGSIVLGFDLSSTHFIYLFDPICLLCLPPSHMPDIDTTLVITPQTFCVIFVHLCKEAGLLVKPCWLCFIANVESI